MNRLGAGPLTAVVPMVLLAAAFGCASPDASSTTTTADSSTSSTTSSTTTGTSPDHESSGDDVWDAAAVTDLVFTGGEAAGFVTTISQAGTYRLTGTLADGQVLVSAPGLVRLLFDNVSLSNSTGAPLNIQAADKAVIVVLSGTSNSLTDGAAYALAAGTDEPNAALYSKADLSIYGQGGSLTVTGRYEDGIRSKDGLVLHDAQLQVTAADDGVRGKDYIVVRGGSLAVSATAGDGLKSDNEDDAGLGYVTIESGTVTISAGDKGVNATTLFTVAGGSLTVTSADDAVHSDTDGLISGGTLALAAGGQGVKVGDTGNLSLTGGTVTVTKSTEGLAGGGLTMTGGTVRVKASDDGLSISRGTDSMAADDGSRLSIQGGWLFVDASGDGIDMNGSGTMSGGTVLVSGPSTSGNAALDYNGTFAVSGGVLIAAGSKGMDQAPSAGSTQVSVKISLGSSQGAGKLFRLQTSAGTEVVTFAPAKQYQSVVVSAPALAQGTAYQAYTGGSSTGTATDGLYSGGTYTAGTLAKSFTTAAGSTVTTVN